MRGHQLELQTVAVRKDGAFSVLKWRENDDEDGRPFAVSVERTFDGGRPVIQAGEYRCTASVYHKGGYPTFEIHVEGHSRILFHRGNVEEDSEGCVLVAASFGVMGVRTAVLDSRTGFGGLMELAAGLQEFYMKVTGR